MPGQQLLLLDCGIEAELESGVRRISAASIPEPPSDRGLVSLKSTQLID
jgi:hypothetical protein